MDDVGYTDAEKAAYQKAHYQNNKQSYHDRRTKTRLGLVALLREAKDRPCFDCGVKYPYYVMDLDHRPGEQKLYNPSALPSMGSKKKLIQEIAKCDVVCSNCHRQRTFERSLVLPA